MSAQTRGHTSTYVLPLKRMQCRLKFKIVTRTLTESSRKLQNLRSSFRVLPKICVNHKSSEKMYRENSETHSRISSYKPPGSLIASSSNTRLDKQWALGLVLLTWESWRLAFKEARTIFKETIFNSTRHSLLSKITWVRAVEANIQAWVLKITRNTFLAPEPKAIHKRC